MPDIETMIYNKKVFHKWPFSRLLNGNGMSYIFEAVVVCSSPEELERQLRNSPNDFEFKVHEIYPSVSAAIINAAREVKFDNAADEALAEQLSKFFGKSLLVLYDDRVGFRYAALYERGDFARAYSDADEIWVLLDDKGEPLREGQRFAWHEIGDDSENEYECILTNIDLGLAELTKSSKVRLPDLKSVL